MICKLKGVNILIIIVVTFITVFVASVVTKMDYNRRCYNLVKSKINDININIKELDKQENTNNLYDSFILVTEIKQDCMMVIRTINFGQKTNEMIALGDLLGYVYYYIDDIQTEDINKESLSKNIRELIQINTIFSRLSDSHFKSQDKYLELFSEEVDRAVNKYPQNTILNQYSSRRIPEEYKTKVKAHSLQAVSLYLI